MDEELEVVMDEELEVVLDEERENESDTQLTREEKRKFTAIGIIAAIFGIAVGILLSGCCSTYKGAKVVDGFNVEMGMTVPGTQMTINFLSYTGGLKVGVNDGCRLSVYNEVIESNSYLFGALTTSRNSKTRSNVYPTVQDTTDGRDDATDDDPQSK